MPCTGSLKSGDSTMLSCLSPCNPCCGPSAADRRTPAAASASIECTRLRVTEAGCASSATRRPLRRFASAGSSASRSMPNCIELHREGVRVVKVRLAGRMAQRPIRNRAALLLDHGRKAELQLLASHIDAGRELEPLAAALHRNRRRSRLRLPTFAVGGEAVRRPLARGREVEFLVRARAGLRDEELAAGVLP